MSASRTAASEARAAGGPVGEASPSLEDGVRLFAAGHLAGSHAVFERAHRQGASDPRAMSWYGLTLVLVERNSNLGVLYCDRAVRLAGPEPELSLNQARVALALGQRERAVRAIARGLERAPGHPALERARQAMGWRRRPVVPFLPRGSFLNRWLGKLRHRLSGGAVPAAGPTPATLGLSPPPEG